MTDVLDFGNYPEFYADEVDEIQQLSGGNRRVIFASWRKIDGVYRRIITGAVIRPAVSFALTAPMFREAAEEVPRALGLMM